MPHPPVRRILVLAVLLLMVGVPDAAGQYRTSPIAPEDVGAARPTVLFEAQDSPSILKHTLVGAALGAAAGVVAYLVVENVVDHWDHSEDGLAFAVLTVPATVIGAVGGLIVGVVRNRDRPAAEPR